MPSFSLFFSHRLVLPRPTNAAPHASYTQGKKLPLHYTLTKGAPLDVMKLLLDANLGAVNATDEVRS